MKSLRSSFEEPQVIAAPRSPWQNVYVERVIGSIRRECLDHIVIFNERHLRRVLCSYVDYYQRTRTPLSLEKDCSDPRPIMPRRIRKVIAIPQVGGLYHRYERIAACSSRIYAYQSLRGGLTASSQVPCIGRFFDLDQSKPVLVRIAGRLIERINSAPILAAAPIPVQIEFLVGTP
jgi:hypothetical protein